MMEAANGLMSSGLRYGRPGLLRNCLTRLTTLGAAVLLLLIVSFSESQAAGLDLDYAPYLEEIAQCFHRRNLFLKYTGVKNPEEVNRFFRRADQASIDLSLKFQSRKLPVKKIAGIEFSSVDEEQPLRLYRMSDPTGRCGYLLRWKPAGPKCLPGRMERVLCVDRPVDGTQALR